MGGGCYQRHAPAALPAGKRPSTHATGGCVSLWTDQDESGKSHPHLGSSPGPYSRQCLTILTELSRYLEPRVVKLIGKSAGRAPSLPVMPWHLPYNGGKRTENPQESKGKPHKCTENPQESTETPLL